MMNRTLIGMLVVMAFFMLGCGNAAEGGDDDASNTTEPTEETTSDNVNTEDEAPTMEETQETEESEEIEEAEETPTSEPEPTPQATTEKKKAPAPAPKPSYQRIAYRTGTTSQVSGSIQGSSTQEYICTLPAEPLTFTLLTDNPAARLMVTNSDGRRLSTAGQEVTYTVPSNGDYFIKVFMNMANDASNQKADYRLQIRAAQ